MIAGSILIALAAGVVVTSLILNASLEDELETQLGRALIRNDLDEIIRYDDLSVNTLTGSATVSGVAIVDPATGDGIRAARVTVRVPHVEALQARQALEDGDPSDVRFTAVMLAVDGIRATVPNGEGFEAHSLTLDVDGALNGALLVRQPEELILALDRVEIALSGAEVLGVGNLDPVRGLGWLGDIRDLTRLDEFHAELLHDRESRELRLVDYLVETPVLSQSGTVRLAYEGSPAQADAWVREVEFDLRSTTAGLPGALALPGGYPDERVVVDIPALDVAVRGATSFADDWMELEPGRTTGRVTIAAGPGGFTLPHSILEGLASYTEGLDELLAGGEVRMERLVVDAELAVEGRVDLHELAVESPLATLTITGTAAIGDMQELVPGSVSVEGRVDELLVGLREQLSGMAAMLGATVPPVGAFGFSFTVDESGQPFLVVE